MIDFVGNLRSRLRVVRRRPGVALVVVTTLAVGIGANTVIFSAVDNVLLKPLPYSGSTELVAAFTNETRKGSPRNPTSPADFLEWKKSSRTLDEMTAAHPWSPVLTGRGQPEPIPGLKATPSLFSLLRAPAALGQVFSSSAEDVVVLSHRLWQRRFGGDPAIVGQTLTLDGKAYAVLGVMAPGFEFPPFWATGAELWTPLRLTAEDERDQSRMLRVFARLRPGNTLQAAQAELQLVGQRLAQEHPSTNAGVAVNVEALQEPVVSRVRPALWLLMGAVGFVLLIACANVASLLLAQGLGREKEIALRAALGADRAEILRELLTDSVVLALSGGFAGVWLAQMGIGLLRAWSPPGFPRLDEIALDGRVVAFNVLLSLAAGILSGLVPALRASRADLLGALRQGDRVVRLGGSERVHDALVVGEFALALVLLVGAGLLTKSFLQLMSPHPGFETSQLLTLSVPFSSSSFHETERQPILFRDLLDRVRGVPGVDGAALVNHLPIAGDTWGLSFTVEGQPRGADDPPSAVFRVATPDYLKTMGIELVRGRAFTEDDRAGTAGVVIVNRTLARRFWADADPVGRRIKQGAPDSAEPWLTVVGVAEDTRQSSLIEPVRPEILFPYTQNPVAWFEETTLVVRTAKAPLSLVEPVKARIWSIDPDLPIVRVQSMAQVLSAAVGQERFNTSLLGAFALLAVFLAVLGMYGVMAYAVTRRRHEIGVRMALGAPARGVFGRVVGRALLLSLLGATLGLLGAQALSGALGRLLVGVSPNDPPTIAAATALLLATSLLASALPARRAAQVDPLVVLREE